MYVRAVPEDDTVPTIHLDKHYDDGFSAAVVVNHLLGLVNLILDAFDYATRNQITDEYFTKLDDQASGCIEGKTADLVDWYNEIKLGTPKSAGQRILAAIEKFEQKHQQDAKDNVTPEGDATTREVYEYVTKQCVGLPCAPDNFFSNEHTITASMIYQVLTDELFAQGYNEDIAIEAESNSAFSVTKLGSSA